MAKLIPMVVALLVMTVGRLEAIRWDKRPEKPTILVEGVNNTGESLKLVWTFVKEPSESIERVTFQRRRDNADPAEEIAFSRPRGGAFTVFSKFISNYSASPPATLILRNPVTNDDEFIYSIVVSLSRNDRPEPSLSDQVQLIVFVPPRITTEPERESEVSVGQNLTLTCIASGDPLPEVTWSKVGQALRLFNVTGPVLHLVNITTEDVGSYKCTAKNKVGEVFRTAVVNIASTPTWPSTHRPSPWTMHTPLLLTMTMHPPRPSTTRPRFAFTISCFPSYMMAHIARDSLPSGADASLLHLNDPSCGVSYVTKKSIIIKAPLKGCGTVRRNIGYKMFFHNKVVVPSGYREKRSLSVFPFKCVYSRFGFP